MNTPPLTPYEPKYELGQDNVDILGMDVHNPVFAISALLIIAFVTGSIMFPELANTSLGTIKNWCIENFDWFFMGSANLVLLFCLFLAASPHGNIRLGGPLAKPDFNRMSWFSMLFAAGMGIGLMFWGVAEPMVYFSGWGGTPLGVEAWTPEAAKLAMAATIYHWGLHAWAIYAVVALSLAFFYYNKGMPLTIRSVFYPLLGDRVWGWTGHFIDILAVLATIFGLATSLGLGAAQASSGLHFLFGIPDVLSTQIAIIIGVTFLATISVVRGLNGGVKILSNTNMILALLLLVFVIFTGPTVAILKGILSTTGAYLSNFVSIEQLD